jgi:hypothetical protein
MRGYTGTIEVKRRRGDCGDWPAIRSSFVAGEKEEDC